MFKTETTQHNKNPTKNSLKFFLDLKTSQNYSET